MTRTEQVNRIIRALKHYAKELNAEEVLTLGIVTMKSIRKNRREKEIK